MSGVGPLETVLGVRRSLSGRHWVWRPHQSRIALAIAQRQGVPEILGRALAGRGVAIEAVADYLAPTLRALLPDPSCLTDLDAAAERLADAAQRGETVGLFGDYDVDGACATALATRALATLGCRPLPYIPNRLTEGYGPNAPAIRALVQRGATLVACLDCGTAAYEALAAAQGLADVLIIDHHQAEGPPPPVLATVNPNRLDCRSGLGHLCATAVVFLVLVGTVRVLRRRGFFAGRAEPDLMALLDLVALATVCDVMPLTGLNRAFVVQGLRVMARRQRTGLAALLDVAGARGAPDAFACGFALGPRLNAAGRLAEADLGLRLLLTENADEARQIAAQLQAINALRQEVEAAMLDEALAQAGALAAAGHATLLVAKSGWHPGVVGIVAGRLRERHNRPVLVAALADGVAKGSARSVPGLDIGAAILAARQSGLLRAGGGHAMAAGFTAQAETLTALHQFLDQYLAAAVQLPGAADLTVESTVQAEGVSADLALQLGRLAPFGNGNEEPVLAITCARVVQSARVGRDGATIRVQLEGESGGPRLKAVAFRMSTGALAEALLSRHGTTLHVAGHLRAETWNGSTTPTLFVSDAAFA